MQNEMFSFVLVTEKLLGYNNRLCLCLSFPVILGRADLPNRLFVQLSGDPSTNDAKGLPFTDVDVKAALVDWLQLRFSFLIFLVLQENQRGCVCLKPRRRTLLGDLDRA